jgi:2-oxoisovalerate dehydrogenase E2 component (dihydrolipoyl transacylase)
VSVREFLLPDPGEGLTEAEIVTWRVAVGDTVKVNDIVVEIETAKSLVELPIPWAGTVAALLAPRGRPSRSAARSSPSTTRCMPVGHRPPPAPPPPLPV